LHSDPETRNPYSPPAARVSDPAVATAPSVVRWTVWTNIATLIVNPLIGAFDASPMPGVPAGLRSAYLAGLLVGLVIIGPMYALLALLLYKIYRQRNWARIAFALLTVFASCAYAPSVLHKLTTNPIIGTLNALSSMATLATVAMVFTPAANRWFRG
jgi:hypothetical protein